MDTIKLDEDIPEKKLQEFDYEVIHRPAEKMRHVDALSRNTIIEAEETECVDGLMVLNNYLIEEDWLTVAQRNEEKPKPPPKPKCEEKPKCPPPKPKCEEPKPKCPPPKPKCEPKCRRKRTKSADCPKKPKEDDCKQSKSAGDKPSKDCKPEMHIPECSVEKAKCPS
ncbi:sperm mitochondrial-associated cysteine-rich protein-like [Ctenocephalides felis]|uniref:sperm mitochondrial-associated cysteine-rich protein-like n=1 Tax=Ctenocephalides felis TaxID=7515 RepID=UPI000E6E437D|nr:sperm mitochondrial-associated cysteine-rich protein-like [Ctenocephalides felis]XP_026476324.1 sperm mitochondrial-associated cysteine-rich protein-like [Ctenocephalides felis]